MKKIILIIVAFALAGCTLLTGQKQPAPPRKVQTLGVLPVLVDAETINYSNRDGLIALLEETSRDVDEWLIEMLRDKGDYFDIRQIKSEGADLFSQLVAARVVEGEGAAMHYRYSFDPDRVSGLIQDRLVDGILVVIINGIERPEKRWRLDSTRLEYLQTEYRSLLYTAVVIAAPSDILWTRPVAASAHFLRLDYPDFTEAHWNMTKEVAVKEISLPGLERTLAELDTGLFIKTTIPRKYNQMILELVDQLKKGL